MQVIVIVDLDIKEKWIHVSKERISLAVTNSLNKHQTTDQYLFSKGMDVLGKVWFESKTMIIFSYLWDSGKQLIKLKMETAGEEGQRK